MSADTQEKNSLGKFLINGILINQSIKFENSMRMEQSIQLEQSIHPIAGRQRSNDGHNIRSALSSKILIANRRKATGSNMGSGQSGVLCSL